MRILLVLLAFSVTAVGQTVYRTTPIQIKKVREFDPKTVENKYDTRLVSKEAPFPNGKSYKEFLLRQKERVSADFPRKTDASNSRNSNAAPDPILVDSFGIKYNLPGGKQLVRGGTPNDNHMAVSDNGYLIAAWNSSIYFHDLEADTPLINPNIGFTYLSFKAFADTMSTDDVFDPKVLYDPKAKRFVLLFLSVDRSTSTYKKSKTVIAFSTTTNPLDKWNIYEIDGHPLKNGTWSDYPQIAFTNDELFFTINLLTGNDWIGDFQRTVIWQIDKNSGYNGSTTLTTNLYDSIYHNGQAIRYLRPVHYGSGPAGDNMYFISNRSIPVNPTDTQSYSYDSLFVAEITNTFASGNAKLKLLKAKANTRTHTSPPARQPNTSLKMWTNDSRVLGAILNNGQIQFVGNSIDTTNGNSAIYHGFVNNLGGPIDVKINIISSPTFDIGFPNMSYTGYVNENQDVLIGFNHTGPSDAPGISAIYYDGKGNYSSIVKLVEGQSFVRSGLNLGAIRWGDYLGMQRVFNEKNTAWIAGYYGKSNNDPSVYLTKVQAPTFGTVVKEQPKKALRTVTFPNPASSRVTVGFNLESDMGVEFNLYNVQGQLVDQLMRGLGTEGKNEFSFGVVNLAKGTYYLKIVGNGTLLSTEKVIVE